MWPHAGWWSWFNQLFHLARSRTSIFSFFLSLQHCNYSISVPNIFDSYLLHANPIVSKTRAKGSAKRDCNNPSCVGVLFSLDAPLISRLRWVWFPWKKNMRLIAVTRWLARLGQRETCSKAKNGIFSDRTGSHADLQESFNLRGAFWVDGKFRDFLENPTPRDLFQARCSLGFVAFPEENTADLWGGTQEFRAGSEFSLTQLQLQTVLFWISALALPRFAVTGLIKQRESRVISGHGIQL